jgi:hypothetical protein
LRDILKHFRKKVNRCFQEDFVILLFL